MPRFHIVAVTADLDRALAVYTPAGAWLPFLDDVPRTKLPAVIDTMFAQVAARMDLVHWAPLPPDPSFAGDSQYCLVIISAPVLWGSAELVSTSALLSGETLSTVQRLALNIALSRLRSPVYPFDSAAQVADALAWAERAIADRTGSPLLSKVRRRCERYNYVVQFSTTAGTLYLKGGPDRIADEATLVNLLWTVRPRQLPETLAVDRVRQCWLYSALPGEPLIGPRLTTTTAAAAARALASLQKQAMTVQAVEEHLSDRRLNAIQLLRRVNRMVEGAFTSTRSAHDAVILIDAWRHSIWTIQNRCTEVDALSLPQTLVISDFWTENVLVTPDGFGFIDVGFSYWSYPFLPLWRFTRDVERQVRTGDATVAITRAFVDEWADVIPASIMIQALNSLGLLGRLFAILMASLSLDLHERGLGTELPAGYRAAYLAPRVRRVLSFVGSSCGATT
jgi:hypothetical protein